MPNTNAVPISIPVTVPGAIAEAVPMVNLNAQIHAFAEYNLQIPNTNAVPISISIAVDLAGAVAEPMPMPMPRLCPWSI